MWPKYLSLSTFAYNTFNTPNLANYSLYELVFGRKLKTLLNLETSPDVKELEVFKITLPSKLYWVLFPIEDLRAVVDTAKRMLTMEKIDKQLG